MIRKLREAVETLVVRGVLRLLLLSRPALKAASHLMLPANKSDLTNPPQNQRPFYPDR